jgi:uncharacterized membrane protein YfcA
MEIFLILAAGILAGFIGAISGGGGLVSISLLAFLGIPLQTALATNKFGGLGSGISSLYKYIKNGKVVWRYVLGLTIAGVLGSLIGSQILLSIDPLILKKLTGLLLLLIMPTVFLKKDFGVEEKETSVARQKWGYVIYFFLAIVSSFFGGLGPVLILNVVWLSGLSFIRANATEYFSSFILSLVSTIIFIAHGIVDYKIGVLLFIGMFIGGYAGAHTAIKKGDAWVKVFFVVVVVISAIKILFF